MSAGIRPLADAWIMEAVPDFNEMDVGLADAGARVGAAEGHGMLCGLFCATGRIDENLWAPYVIDLESGSDSANDRCTDMIRRLGNSIVESILSGELGFDLLLPGDQADLVCRSEALGAWCQGMLFGLGLGGAGDASTFPDNSKEMLADLVRISRIDSPDEEDVDGDERAFVEVSEYVRIGTLLICEELHEQRNPPGLNDSVH